MVAFQKVCTGLQLEIKQKVCIGLPEKAQKQAIFKRFIVVFPPFVGLNG
jgi:hypothetical protein